VIIKGRAVRSIKHWGRYLSEVGENEKAVQHEIRGTVATKLKEALWEMWDIARATKTKGNFLYHASFNPPANESLTPEQWRHAIDLVEERMGFQGHQRIVYEHVKDGRQHFHVLWNRTDPENITIRDIKGDRYTLRRVSNQLEREFGLTPTKAVRDYDDPRSYAEWEITGRGRQRLHVEQIKAELTALWKQTASARDFMAAVEERGYKFAKGDKRDFVVLDALGDVHSLARRLDGVRVADLRARMKHIDRDSLPDVEQARLAQREPFLDKGGVFDRDAADRDWEQRLERGAIKHEEAKDERKRESLRHPVFDRDAQDREWQGRLSDAAMGHAAKAFEAEERRPRSFVEKTIAHLLASYETPEDFTKALAAKRLMPARATEKGIAEFRSEIHARNLDADRAWRHASVHDDSLPSPKLLNMPELKPDELVMVNRWGGVHRLGHKRVDFQALTERWQAALGEVPTLEAARADMKFQRDLREQKYLGQGEAFNDILNERRADARQRADERAEKKELHRPFDGVPDRSEKGIKVLSGATGMALGLLDFVTSLLDPAPARPALREQGDAAQSQRSKALERMRKNLDRNQPVHAQDIRLLNQHDLLQLRERGDSHLRYLIAEQDRKRQRSWGWER
jgi:hypothetical protein